MLSSKAAFFKNHPIGMRRMNFKEQGDEVEGGCNNSFSF